MRSRVPRKSVDFESIDLGDSLHSYPPGTNPNNLAPYKVAAAATTVAAVELDFNVVCRRTGAEFDMT